MKKLLFIPVILCFGFSSHAKFEVVCASGSHIMELTNNINTKINNKLRVKNVSVPSLNEVWICVTVETKDNEK